MGEPDVPTLVAVEGACRAVIDAAREAMDADGAIPASWPHGEE